MFALDLVWEPLYLVKVEMTVHDVRILNCFRERAQLLFLLGPLTFL